MVATLLALGCAPPEPLAAAPWPPAAGCEARPVQAGPGRTVPLTLRVERGVDPAEGRAAVAAAIGWWAEAGVVFVAGPGASVAPGPVLGGEAAALEAAVAGLPPAEADRRVREAVAGPLAARLGTGVGVEVVLVSALAPPGSPAARVAEPAGLGLSPAGGALPPALRALLPAEFAPTVFLDAPALRALGPAAAAGVAAHELGHALGLAHDGEAGNLMAPEPAACRPGLRADQVAALALPGG